MLYIVTHIILVSFNVMGVSYTFLPFLVDQRMIHCSSCYILCCIDNILSSQWIFILLNYLILMYFVEKPIMFSKYMLICNYFSFYSFGVLMCLLTLNDGGPKHVSQVSQHFKYNTYDQCDYTWFTWWEWDNSICCLMSWHVKGTPCVSILGFCKL